MFVSTSERPSLGFTVIYDINASSQKESFLSYSCKIKIFMRSLSMILNWESIRLTFGFSGTSFRMCLTKSLIDYSQYYPFMYASISRPLLLTVLTLPNP